MARISFSKLRFYESRHSGAVDARIFFPNGYGALVYAGRDEAEAGMYVVRPLVALEPHPRGNIGKDSAEIDRADLPIREWIGLQDVEQVERILSDLASLPKVQLPMRIEIPIEIPNMPMWEQIGGDMNPGQYGATIARNDGDALELLKIQPVREYVGGHEAANVGFPFWTREAYFDLDDLDTTRDDVRAALHMIGMNLGTLETDFAPTARALVIAEALLDYGRADEGPAGWSKDILSEKVRWSSGEVAGPEYLADEDEAFRREVLEEDEDEEDGDEEGEEDEEEEAR